jgi:lipoyl(octanoyl) transferase
VIDSDVAVTALWLGVQPYAPMVELQQALLERRRAGQLGNVLLLLEHPPTITLGRGTHPEHLLASAEVLSTLGVAVERTSRGGDITLHAPGQLVAYPIITLPEGQRDVRRYVKNLSEVMRRLLAAYGVSAGTLARYIGIWADQANPEVWPGEEQVLSPVKLGAIGVRISRWTTSHGFALNLCTDLSWFRLIVPCGISEHGVASVASLTAQQPEPRDVAPAAHQQLCEVLGFPEGAFLDLAPEAASEERVLAALARRRP